MSNEQGEHGMGLRTVNLAAALVWLLAIPLCPLPISNLFGASGAALFIGLLLLGCALSCLLRLTRETAPPSRVWASRHTALLLPAGILVAGLTSLCAAPASVVWCCIGSILAGFGEGTVLLEWGKRLSPLPTRQAVGLLARGSLGGIIAGCLVCLLGRHSPALLALLTTYGVLACLPMRHADQPHVCADDTKDEFGRIRALFAQLWEPALGLGLSLMSAILPWGSLFSGTAASMPVYWSFAVGIATLCVAAEIASKRLAKTPDFDMATHVAIPVLAAAVVGLRMLGDLEQIGVGLTTFKGIGSGAASVGFLLLAFAAMARVARKTGDAEGAFGLGLGVACLIGFVTLPLHMAHQQFASLVAPFLSLVFLVASCCSSVVHIHRRVASQEPKTLTIEAAVTKLCHEYHLTPRERQVMGQLMLGRSAERIGAVLGISPNTVRSHVGNIHTKLGISSRDDLADLIEATMHGDSKATDNKTPAQRPSS